MKAPSTLLWGGKAYKQILLILRSTEVRGPSALERGGGREEGLPGGVVPEHNTEASAALRLVKGLRKGGGEKSLDLRTFEELPAGQPGWAIRQ